MISLTLLIFIYLFVFHLHLPIIHMSSLSSPHFSQQEQATKVTSYLPAVCYVSFCNCIKKILSKEFSILDTMDLFFFGGVGGLASKYHILVNNRQFSNSLSFHISLFDSIFPAICRVRRDRFYYLHFINEKTWHYEVK